MGNNIEHWNLKIVKDFSLPLEPFYDNEDCRVELLKKSGVLIDGGAERGEIKGTLFNDDRIEVSDIQISGVGSSGAYYWMVKEVFVKSRGVMIATMIWESGDIEKIIVKNGVIKQEGVEI